ncbi:MAG TPA: sugar transferase [Bryobacteraceae bacterium]|nr:sugar transferase [Bryobacteraceae bacterium]
MTAFTDAVLPEADFTRTLCLERKRTERSRRRFVLMLVELGRKVSADQDSMDKVLATLCQSTRDTDITGWYAEGGVIGVIFTEIGPAEARVIVHALKSRVTAAMSKTLSSEQIKEIRLSFRVFPEEWGGDGGAGQADTTFYPDLMKERDARKGSRALKRSLDILGSLTALVLLVPVYLVIGIAIRLTSRGPILFSQKRIGQYGNPFTFLKFRSMYASNDATIHKEYVKQLIAGLPEPGITPDGKAKVYKLTKDPRVTTVGRFLRRTSLDEIPQFWNVLTGDMSLVGPRPPLPYELEAYDVWHKRRLLDVKPGITGLWQVAARSRVKFDDMVRLDLRYARTWSLGLDLKILLKTPGAMFSGDGAH